MTSIDDDIPHIQAAIERAFFSVPEDDGPRARVGAVLVRDGVQLGIACRGEHVPGEHAEFCLLERKLAGVDVVGSTLYTTLAPPIELIVKRGIRRLVVGMMDPHPFHACRVLPGLRRAGVEFELFPQVYMSQVEALNREFIAHRGRDPFDGRMSSG